MSFGTWGFDSPRRYVCARCVGGCEDCGLYVCYACFTTVFEEAMVKWADVIDALKDR